MEKYEYINDPCKASSLPYWKSISFTAPDDIMILHSDEIEKIEVENYNTERYFKLIHSLHEFPEISLPEGYAVTNADLYEFSDHIKRCYLDINMDIEIIKSYTKRHVYSSELWIAVKDTKTDKIAASGIAEFDAEVKEGILEWIQVSNEHRRKGIGAFVVCELLRRLSKMADFVTVSGKSDDISEPEKLYRKCGFTGDEVWYICKGVEK